MPGLRSVEVDLRTALFAVAASIAAAILAGAVPALGVMRTRLASWLADRSGGSGPGAMRAQQALAIGQIGLAVALLVTARCSLRASVNCAPSILDFVPHK